MTKENEFDFYFEKIYNFYNVSTIRDLSEVINTSESTISKWNQRKSLSAIKKKCRELGIYNEIFGRLELSLSEIAKNNMTAEDLIEKLLNYYNLTSLQELAEKLNIKQSSLSSWKSRNSINAIRNKCRELGIYNEIFNDSQISNKEESFPLDLILYNNINMKRALKNWGTQGYGIAVGIILYLKENGSLDLSDIYLLADDLKTSAFLIQKVIEDCNFLVQENNKIKLRIEL